MDIKGKKVLLTGATGGIGRTMAQHLARDGAHLILSSRSEGALASMADALPGQGHSVLASDLGEPGAAADLAVRAGHVDCLIANAALPSTGKLSDLTEEQIQRMLRINLESPILLCQALLPAMLERSSGKLVMIGSLAGKLASPRSSIYNASKFGIRGFALGLKGDLAGTGVGITLVTPGFVSDAGMFADSGVSLSPAIGTTTPQKVAGAVLRAIRTDRPEITVAPVTQKVAAHLGLVSPSLSYRMQSGSSGQKTAEKFAAGQTDKR